MIDKETARLKASGLEPYMEGFELSGSLLQDVGTFFKLHQDNETWDHTLKVTSQSVRIARLYGVDPQKAEQAALLHDISNVIPVSQMVQVSEQLSIQILEEELKYPRILHQKLSRAIAEHIFEIKDAEILQAIECHTTLKAKAALFDKVVFIADKVAWDLPGEHSYLNEIRTLVDAQQLDKAVFTYLDHVWSQRNQLKLVHCWTMEARKDIMDRIRRESSPLTLHIQRMFHHLIWAHARIIHRLEEEQVVPERPLRLLFHILWAEAVWLSRLNGHSGPTATQGLSVENATLEDCKSLADSNREGFARYFAELKDEHLRNSITYMTSKGLEFTTDVEDILTHVSLHGSYHRGQIASYLRLENLTPPVTDYIDYVRKDGIDYR